MRVLFGLSASRLASRRAVSSASCPSVPVSAPAEEVRALRSANRTEVDARLRGRLAGLAVPFRSALLGCKQPGPSGDGQSKTHTSLAYNLTEQDVRSLGFTGGTAEVIERVLSLEYSSQAEVTRHNIKKAIETFARGLNDTGSPEVQAAIWTVRIIALEEHTSRFRHDYTAKRKITEYKDQRRKILKYLKRVSLERFFQCVDRLGLPHDLVESVSPAYPSFKYRKPKESRALHSASKSKSKSRLEPRSKS